MDIQLEKKKGIPRKYIPYIIGGVVFVAALVWLALGNFSSTLKVERKGLSVVDVKKLQFDDFVRMDGRVAPISIVQISPEEGGIVMEKVVEEGAHVKKGDVIVSGGKATGWLRSNSTWNKRPPTSSCGWCSRRRASRAAADGSSGFSPRSPNCF